MDGMRGLDDFPSLAHSLSFSLPYLQQLDHVLIPFARAQPGGRGPRNPHPDGLMPGQAQLLHGGEGVEGAQTRDEGKDGAGEEGSEDLGEDGQDGQPGRALEDGGRAQDAGRVEEGARVLAAGGRALE